MDTNQIKKAAGLQPTALQSNYIKQNYHTKSLMHKPLPPYGGKFLKRIASGKPVTNDIWLCAGHECWQYAAQFMANQAVLALPWDDDPQQYQWPVKELGVLVLDCAFYSKKYAWSLPIKNLRFLAYILLESGATTVWVLCANGQYVVYRREAS